MKRLYLILLFLLIVNSEVFSQANAGPDKTVSNKKTRIGTPDDGKSCYHWEATPADPSLNANVAQPEVFPTETTVYKLTVTGQEFSNISTDEVTVYKFGIEYIKHSAGKEWKVVVDEPIEYSAIASAECKNWEWDMPDGFPDAWNPQGGNKQKGNNMKIPNSDLVRAINAFLGGGNSWFGDKYGTFTVKCIDGQNIAHRISSTDLIPSKKVKVFYKKDAISKASIPNWFYFWKQFIPQDRIADLIYDNSIGDYAVTNPQARTTKISQRASEKNDETSHHGLHTFYETVAHENHHIVLWEGWWGAGGQPDPADDTDNDTYPDSWERTDPAAIAAGFIVGNDDTYDSGDPNVGRPPSVGYTYEERECRAVEHALAETTYDSYDWSYDPTGINQGKQW